MKDYVYSPRALFVSYKFMYEKAFFIGTRNAIYVCPTEKDPLAQSSSGSIFNLIEGKRADLFLLEFVKRPDTNAEKVHELFSTLIERNNKEGENNIAFIDITQAIRLRFDVKWFNTGIVVGHTTNLLGNKYSISNFGKEYKKGIGEFYKQYYPLNKLLKAEENFQ